MGCVSVLNKPNPIDIAPCVCLDGNGTDRLTLYLDCNNKNLDDTKLSLILNYFLAPGISPLGALILSQNQLTKIPDQIKQFDKLNYVDLDQNKMQSVASGAITFTKLQNSISLGFNQLSTISPGAFQGAT